MPTWKFTEHRIDGKARAATIFGVRITDGKAKDQFSKHMSRHHLIDIQQLQNLWNAVVDRNDEDTMAAMAHWAGATSLLPAKPYNMLTTSAPGGLLRKIAWNPFNLIIGPSTNYRLGDPANDFDHIEFRSFPKFSTVKSPEHIENLARQEFNTHVRRLRDLYLLMQRYLDEIPPPQIVDNLRQVLRSDTPASYPVLMVGTLTGCSLLHPALWRDYTTLSGRGFINQEDPKKFSNAIIDGVAPYVSASYFPDFQIKPSLQHKTLLEELKDPPTGDPLARIVTAERGLLERSTCRVLLESKLQPIQRFATGGGLRVYVCGPSENGLFSDIVSNIAGAVASIVQAQPSYKLTFVPMARSVYSTLEVRIYPR